MSKSIELNVFKNFIWEKDDPKSKKIIFLFTTSIHTYIFIDYSDKTNLKITGMGWSRGGIGGKIKYKSQKEAWMKFFKFFNDPIEFKNKEDILTLLKI